MRRQDVEEETTCCRLLSRDVAAGTIARLMRLRGWVQLVSLIAAVALLFPAFGGSTRAAAAVYWGSSSGLGAANLDGSDPQWNYFYWPYANESQGPACGVAVNSEYLYWASPEGIARRKLEGEGIYPGTVVPHLHGPCGVALDQSHLYWANLALPANAAPRTGSIGRANLDGSEATTLVTGLEHPCAVALGGDHLFWFERRPSGQDFGGVGRAGLDGSSPQRLFVPFHNVNPGCGLAASGGYLYWEQDEAIARANLQGGEVEETFIPKAGLVDGIAVQSGYIYWVTRGPLGNASIGRARLDGSEADPTWITSGELEFGGIAVDDRPTAPYLILPSRSIRFAQNVEYNLRSGALLLGVYVPPQGPPGSPSPPQGRLEVRSPWLSWKISAGTSSLAAEGGSYLWQVRIRSGRGQVGRRIRLQLRRRGWAPVKVTLVYETERVYPVEATRKLILRRYPGARGGWVKHPGPPGGAPETPAHRIGG